MFNEFIANGLTVSLSLVGLVLIIEMAADGWWRF